MNNEHDIPSIVLLLEGRGGEEIARARIAGQGEQEEEEAKSIPGGVCVSVYPLTFNADFLWTMNDTHNFYSAIMV